MTAPVSPTTDPSATRRPLRLLARIAGRVAQGLALVLASLLIGVLSFALFPPSDLLRRAALPIAQQALNHPNLHIGALTLRPLGEIEIRDLWLGPPRGYSEPMFTVKRIVVRHDISRVAQGQILVRQVQVERPVLRVEQKQGKLNWLAFVEGLPPSEPPPEEEPPPGEPSDMQILVDRVSIIGFGASVDDGQRKLALDSLNLALWALIRGPKITARLNLDIESPWPEHPSLAFIQDVPPKASGRLDTRFGLNVDLELTPGPKADSPPNVQALVDLGLSVESRRLTAIHPLEPIKLKTLLRARADTGQQRARLEDLQVHFNDSQLLKLSATVNELLTNQQLDLLLSRLHLPLSKLAPYARAFVQGVDFGGQIDVRQLKMATALKSAGAQLPRLSGELALENIWANVSLKAEGEAEAQPLEAQLKDLSFKLYFGTRPNGKSVATTREQILEVLPGFSEDQPSVASLMSGDQAMPSVLAQGRLRLGEASASGAQIRDLDLTLAAGATLQGTEPNAFASRLGLSLPSIHYQNPQLGRVRLSLSSDLQAGGDWRDKLVVLDRLKLNLADLIKVKLAARVENLGNKALLAQLELEPLSLARLLRLVPAKIRAKLGALKLGGSVGLLARIDGRLPAQGTRPLKMPVKLDTRLKLNKVSVNDSAQQLALSGLGGEITVRGTPSDLKLGTRLGISRLNKADQQATVGGLKLDTDIAVKPRRTHLKLVLKADQIRKADAGMVIKGLGLSTEVNTAVALDRLIDGAKVPAVLGKTRINIKHWLSSMTMASLGNTISVGQLSANASVDLDPTHSGRPTLLQFGQWIASVSHKEQGLRVKGLQFNGSVEAPLPLKKLMAGKPASLRRVKHTIILGLDQILLVQPGNTLRINDISTAVKVGYDASATDSTQVGVKAKVASLGHKQQQVRLKGLALDLKTAVRGMQLDLPAPVLEAKRVAAQLGVKLDSLRQQGFKPLNSSSVELDAVVSKLSQIKLRKVAVRMPSNGLRLDLTGSASNLLSASASSLPPFDLSLEAGLDNPVTRDSKKATFIAPGIKAAGRAGIKLRVRGRGDRRITLDTRLFARNFNLWQRGVTVAEREPSGFLRTESLLHLKDLNADVPISQQVVLNLPKIALPRPKRSIFKQQSASVLYKDLRPYSGKQAKLAIGGLEIKERIAALNRQGHLISTARRTNRVDKVSLDLSIADSSLLLNRLYLKLFSGDIAGAVQAQVLGLDPVDLRLGLRTQVTGVNLAHLDPEAKERTAKTEVSAMVDLKYELCRQYVEGRIDITQLSLDMLDSLLAYLDPNKVNESVQKNRKLINSWYVKLANPQVKLVSIWINHGNLNMDIEMDAMAPVGTILERTLKNNRIRRINILPFLPRCRAKPSSKER